MPGFLAGPRTGFVDRMKGKGMCSSGFLQQIGSSAALSAGGGNVFSQLSAAGVGNGADATDDTLMSCSIPPNLFDIPGRQLFIQAYGTVTATSATKTVQFKWGASALQSLVVYVTTGTGSWQFNASITKVSANIQSIVYQVDAGGTVSTVLGAASGRQILVTSGSEVDTAAIPLVITGKSSDSGAARVLCNALIVDAYN